MPMVQPGFPSAEPTEDWIIRFAEKPVEFLDRLIRWIEYPPNLVRASPHDTAMAYFGHAQGAQSPLLIWLDHAMTDWLDQWRENAADTAADSVEATGSLLDITQAAQILHSLVRRFTEADAFEQTRSYVEENGGRIAALIHELGDDLPQEGTVARILWSELPTAWRLPPLPCPADDDVHPAACSP